MKFGNADGGKDKVLTAKTFVKTKSISKFLKDEHSIIIGAMGSGKSAIFKLLKDRSDLLDTYLKYEVISVQETISFHDLRQLIQEKFPNIDSQQMYYLIWKFQIASKLAENIRASSNTSFPETKQEEDINIFLQTINAEYTRNTINVIKNLFDRDLSIGFEVNDTPFNLSYKKGNIENRISLDYIIEICSKIVSSKKNKPYLLIIDKIDTFVAGEEYDIQRLYIQALLAINEDIQSKCNNIKLKIFLRSDLFIRLDLEAHGWDKINDDVLKIQWTNEEIIQFIAKRILYAFEKEKILHEYSILQEMNLQNDIYFSDLNFLEKLLLKLPFKSLKEKGLD